MARSFNQAIIIGNMARDPELRTVPSGQSVASFAVATNRTWQDANGEQQEAADFHNITAWGKLAELASQYLSKGRKVMIVGRLQTRSWEDDGGKKNYRTEIVANEINFLDSAGGGSSDFDSAAAAPSPPSEDKVVDKSKSKTTPKKDAPPIEDLDADLSDIPF